MFLSNRTQKQIYLFLGLLLFPILVISASLLFPALTGSQSKWFGLNQLSNISLSSIIQTILSSGLFCAGCFLLSVDKLRIAGVVLLLSLLFFFKSSALNQDGQDLLWKIPADVESIGAHVVHDEMLELYTHSVFWDTLNKFGDFSVEFSYHVLSVSSGILFLLALVFYAKENINTDIYLFILLVCSGGFIQLFFGDVENYSITSAIVMWYFLVGSRVLKGKSSNWLAAAILGLAMCFHLEAGFLLPSLAYLVISQSIRTRRPSHLLPLLLPFSMILCCMILLDQAGILPIENLWLYSHATAHGGNIASVLPPLSLPYYIEMYNLLLLLFPSFILLPCALVKEKVTQIDCFLLIAVSFLMLLPLAWKAALGVLNDWNLYAILAIPCSILVWSKLLPRVDTGRMRVALIVMLVFSMLNTFAWVVKNHAV